MGARSIMSLTRLGFRPCAHGSGSVGLRSFLDLIQNFSGVHTGLEPQKFACTRERIQVDPIWDKYTFDVGISRSHELKYKKVLRPLLYTKLASFPICTFFGSHPCVHTGAKWIGATRLRSFYPYLVGTDSGTKQAPISWSQCAR